jgi:hypothetical protein
MSPTNNLASPSMGRIRFVSAGRGTMNLMTFNRNGLDQGCPPRLTYLQLSGRVYRITKRKHMELEETWQLFTSDGSLREIVIFLLPS